jgi:Domain of unknown function (DUF4398)
VLVHKRALFLLLSLASASGALCSGCGPFLYTVDSIGAGSAVAEAEQADAADRAPYEYYAALSYLEKAREESGEGHYDAAIRYAQRAHDLGNRALTRARAAGRESSSGGERE